MTTTLMCIALVGACTSQPPPPRTDTMRVTFTAAVETTWVAEQVGAVLARHGARAFLREMTLQDGQPTLVFEGEVPEAAKQEIAARIAAPQAPATRPPEIPPSAPAPPPQRTAAPTPTAGPIDMTRADAAARRVMPSVVLLTGTAQGTGVIVSADGYILTNAHVAKSLASGSSTAQLHDGRRLPVRVIGYVESLIPDIGVVKIEATGLPTVELGDGATVRPGDPLLAIGHPGGYGYWLVTAGRAFSADRSRVQASPSSPLVEFVQLNTGIPSSQGSSGGPFVDLNGKVVGILSGPIPTEIVEPAPAPLRVVWTWDDFLALSLLGSTGIGSEDATRYMREIVAKGGNLP